MSKTLKLISWNVNGIRAVYKKGFEKFLKTHAPDILCLQETKAHESQLGFDQRPTDYHGFFNEAERKGYSGVVTFSKDKPKSVNYQFAQGKYFDEGRVLVSEYEDFLLYNVYFPNGKRSPERLKYKMDFYEDFYKHIKEQLKNQKNIIVCGDVNTAHREIDLARPKENEKISGFLPKERAWIDKFLRLGFYDSFRLFNEKPDNYSWWSMRTRARERNVGWRIDYFFVSEALKNRVKKAEILSNVLGSDHAPITLELKTSS